MAKVEIIRIHNDPVGPDTESKLTDEYVVIKNMTTDESFKMVGWIVSDRTPTGEETHLFYFPQTVNGGTWTLDPGEYIFLMTGKGTNKFLEKNGSNPPQFHFFMQRGWFVWNNSGDTAYLRLPNGEFIHWMKVP